MLFTNGENSIFVSTDSGANWNPYYEASFSRGSDDMTVSAIGYLRGRAVYVCLNGAESGNRLWVADGSSGWSERSAGLPEGTAIRRVVPHPTNSQTAYALMNGLGSPGAKLYRTTNRGYAWTNISGNLPNVPLGDLVVHPSDDTPEIRYLTMELLDIYSRTASRDRLDRSIYRRVKHADCNTCQ